MTVVSSDKTCTKYNMEIDVELKEKNTNDTAAQR